MRNHLVFASTALGTFAVVLFSMGVRGDPHSEAPVAHYPSEDREAIAQRPRSAVETALMAGDPRPLLAFANEHEANAEQMVRLALTLFKATQPESIKQWCAGDPTRTPIDNQDEQLLTGAVAAVGLKTLKNVHRYETTIQLARGLIAPNSETPGAAGMVDTRSLLAYLSAQPMDANLSELDDVLIFAAGDSESAKQFLTDVSSLRWELPCAFHDSKPTCRWLASGLVGPGADGTWAQQDKMLDELLAQGGIEEERANSIKERLLASADLDLSSKADVANMPESWQSPLAESALLRMEGRGSEAFFETVNQLGEYLSPLEIIQVAQRNRLEPDAVFGPEMAALIPPGSLLIQPLFSIQNGATAAKFAIENPSLIKGGGDGITSYFNIWAQFAPMEASAFIVSLPDSREKYFAVKGLIDRISASDPDSAAIWTTELNRLGR